MRAGARKVVSDSDNRVMSLIIGYRRSRTESEKRDNSVIRHPFPPGGAAQKREVGENDIWATWAATVTNTKCQCALPMLGHSGEADINAASGRALPPTMRRHDLE